jgi:hypothetical protein
LAHRNFPTIPPSSKSWRDSDTVRFGFAFCNARFGFYSLDVYYQLLTDFQDGFVWKFCLSYRQASIKAEFYEFGLLPNCVCLFLIGRQLLALKIGFVSQFRPFMPCGFFEQEKTEGTEANGQVSPLAARHSAASAGRRPEKIKHNRN